MSYETRLEQFKELIRKIEYYKYTQNSLIYWDKITNMPPAGIKYRSKVMSFMADEQYKLLSGREFTNHVKYFSGHKKNDELTNAMLRRIVRNSQYISRIPENEYVEYAGLIAKSEQVWEKARAENDYESFKPYLKSIIDTFKKFAEYWGYEDDPYDAIMEYYEVGLNVKLVDELVSEMKPFLIETLARVSAREAGNKRTSQTIFASEAEQKKIWNKLLDILGFDFQAGRLDIGSHPTVLANSPSDVRIVNSYKQDDIKAGIFNVLHSCGKAIYQQSIDDNLLGTFLAEAPSFAMEEGVGRLYENIIGRNHGTINYFFENYGAGDERASERDADEIFRLFNLVNPSLIRINADELTYMLHIIIRYEIERELINGRLDVDRLPEVWNRKYEDYLGITPDIDSNGVLQDIHWAAGYFGYFPAYFIANIISAQLMGAIERDCGSFNELTGSGEFRVIKEWLKENIFRYGAIYDTRELVERATGKLLSSEDYISYLRQKMTEVYKL